MLRYCSTVFGIHVEKECFKLGDMLNMPLRYWQIRGCPLIDTEFP